MGSEVAGPGEVLDVVVGELAQGCAAAVGLDEGILVLTVHDGYGEAAPMVVAVAVADGLVQGGDAYLAGDVLEAREAVLGELLVEEVVLGGECLYLSQVLVGEVEVVALQGGVHLSVVGYEG